MQPCTSVHRALLVAVACACSVVASAGEEGHPIDAAHSTVTVYVYKSGLFSAFADNHVITAPLASGTISTEPPLAIEIAVHAGDLRVLDPGLAPDRRSEVQARMLGPEVLDAATFPDITFTSTSVEPAGTDAWNATGRLTIHGRTRTVTVHATAQGGRYHGSVNLRQRDFGIEPIRIAGGTVKVKDELKIEFDIAQ